MQKYERLMLYLKEAFLHIERLNNILAYLKKFYPITNEKIDVIDANYLDAFAYRFAKLQDLLGAKIFRVYLEVNNFPVQDKNFLTLLKELQKEGIVDIDKWAEFRGVRNTFAHDYPYEESQKIEAINYLIQNINYLFEVAKKIKDQCEIK